MTELLINATMIVNRGQKLIISVRRYVQFPCVVGSLLRSSKYWWKHTVVSPRTSALLL